LGATWEGKCHDKRAADSESYQFPQGSRLYHDLGFQGLEIAGIIIILPKKKPRGGALTAEEKEENRRISSRRVLIRHYLDSLYTYDVML
jgi:hypothetical protein